MIVNEICPRMQVVSKGNRRFWGVADFGELKRSVETHRTCSAYFSRSAIMAVLSRSIA
jgi:hypothetical protein